MKRKDQNIQNTKLYSPVPEGREGLIFICYLQFQDTVGRRKSDSVGMGGRAVKTGISLSIRPRICVPITSFTLPIPASPHSSRRASGQREHIKEKNFFFFTRISLTLNMQLGAWKMQNIHLSKKPNR